MVVVLRVVQQAVAVVLVAQLQPLEQQVRQTQAAAAAAGPIIPVALVVPA